MIYASKTTFCLNNLKILMPKAMKILRIWLKNFCEFPHWPVVVRHTILWLSEDLPCSFCLSVEALEVLRRQRCSQDLLRTIQKSKKLQFKEMIYGSSVYDVQGDEKRWKIVKCFFLIFRIYKSIKFIKLIRLLYY